ncbi:phage terminase large subunit [Xanthobacter flavus]|uniref:phage terminase large subunit n=1 Tax=Xanthobacter flavus TaxID=281 RepID=UPI003729204E
MASTTVERSSYTVFQLWRLTPDEIFELHDLRRFRIPPERAGTEALLFAKAHSPHIVLVEDMNAGLLVADTLKRAGPCLDTIRPTQSKEQRLLRCLAAFHSMKVRLPREAPWLEDFLAQLLAFPGSRHDDQVDATSQALNFAICYFQGEIKIKGFSPNGSHIGRTLRRPKDHPLRPRPPLRGLRRW